MKQTAYEKIADFMNNLLKEGYSVEEIDSAMDNIYGERQTERNGELS